MDLKDASVGDVVNFTYRQPQSGTHKRYLAKVEDVRNLSHEEIVQINSRSLYRKYDPEFERTCTLVTCSMPGGHTRNFYAERTEDCSKPSMGCVMYAIQDVIERIKPW